MTFIYGIVILSDGKVQRPGPARPKSKQNILKIFRRRNRARKDFNISLFL